MDLVEVKQEIYKGSKRLDEASREIFKLAKDMAASEREYRIALSKELVALREKGVSVGVINDIARGNLADLKYKRDVSELTYQAGRDSLKAIQSQLSALQSILRSQEEI